MTREEQLDWLCRLRSKIYVYMPKEWLIPMNDALDMAIKTLEKQPCEDCVSRQAVLDMTTVIETDDYSGNEIMEVVDTDDIKALPSVTPTKCIATVKFSKEDMQKLIDEKMKEIVVESRRTLKSWISSEDHLPAEGEYVLVYFRKCDRFEVCFLRTIDYVSAKAWKDTHREIHQITDTYWKRIERPKL